MKGTGDSARRWAAVVLFLLVFGLSLRPIRSYDYFWHLATGRWIVEHGALPMQDPFALASAHVPWINGEWLFQVPVFEVWKIAGHAGVILLVAALLGGLFAWLFKRLADGTDWIVATFVVIVCWSQAAHRLDARPETAGVLLLPAAIAVLANSPTWRRTILAAAIAALWINLHPSALLMPVVVACFLVGDLIAARAEASPPALGPIARGRVVQLFAVSAALLVNPWGIQAIEAPIRLATWLRESGVVNREWLPTSPIGFPWVYVTIAAAFVVLLVPKDRLRWTGSIFVLGLLSFLAIRYVRNHAFLFAAMPLLVAPALPKRIPTRARSILGASTLLVLVVATLVHPDFGLGPDRTVFPIHAVDDLAALQLRGHIYDPDQFGGYLIWRFYGERRVLTDGRNELYHAYIGDYAKARVDSRAWDALIHRYDLVLAVDEYRDAPVRTVDATTGRAKELPASLVYFPRTRWALLSWDDVGMVFARRDAFPARLIAAHEIRSLVPDASSPDTVAIGDPAVARAELDRAIRKHGLSRRAAFLRHLLRERLSPSGDRGGETKLD